MTIKLTSEIISYAQSVGKIGERMGKTAKSFGEVAEREVSSLYGIKDVKKDYEKLLSEFISQENDLKNLTSPKLLAEEHKNLVNSYDKYVAATRTVIESFDTDNVKVDKGSLKEAQDMQWRASGEIVKISNEIAQKLGIK